MSFEQIERILNDQLAKFAKEYTAWWNNEIDGSHVQARSWIDAGWKVDKDGVNLKEKWDDSSAPEKKFER